MATKAERFAAELVKQNRQKASEAILAGRADGDLATVLSTARNNGWAWSQRSTKGSE